MLISKFILTQLLAMSCLVYYDHGLYGTSFNKMQLYRHRKVPNNSADPANKAKLILLLGGFNNTGELESQLKRISMPPISSESSCFNDYRVSSELLLNFDAHMHTHMHINACTCTQQSVRKDMNGLVHNGTCTHKCLTPISNNLWYGSLLGALNPFICLDGKAKADSNAAITLPGREHALVTIEMASQSYRNHREVEKNEIKVPN